MMLQNNIQKGGEEGGMSVGRPFSAHECIEKSKDARKKNFYEGI